MKKIIFCILILLGFGDIFCSDFSLNRKYSRRTISTRSFFTLNTRLNEKLHPFYLENRMHLFNVIMRNIHKQDLAEIIAFGSTHIKSETAKNGMRGVDALAKINSGNISLDAFLQINEAVLQTFNRNEAIYRKAFRAVNQRGYTFVRISHDYLTGTRIIEELLPIVYYDNYYNK